MRCNIVYEITSIVFVEAIIIICGDWIPITNAVRFVFIDANTFITICVVIDIAAVTPCILAVVAGMSVSVIAATV